MKLINVNNTTGGRPLFINDILTVEENFYKHSQAQFQNRGAFIISGVIATEGAISQGVVIIDNEVMSFEGAAGVSFPVYLVKETSFSDNVVFQNGETKPLYIENKAVVSSTIPSSGEYISISASGGKRYTDALMNDLVGLKGNQTISGNKTFTNTVTVGGLNVKEEINKKANVAQESWKNLALINGATRHPSSLFGNTPIPAYFKDSLGFVHLRSVLAMPFGSEWTHVATLPLNYRPESSYIIERNNDSTSRIHPDGKIFVSGDSVILDHVIFRAA